MLFYKAEGLLVEDPFTQDVSQRQIREIKREILLKSTEYNESLRNNSFYFVVGIVNSVVTVGVITDDRKATERPLYTYLKKINCTTADLTVREVTTGEIMHLLVKASRNDYIADDDEVMANFGLNGIQDRRLEYGDNILEDRNRREVEECATRYLFGESFRPELDRIYAGNASGNLIGHPVHYMIQTDDTDARREISRCLLQSLYANNRLYSKRYTFLDVSPGKSISLMPYENLYNLSLGGAVLVRYTVGSDAQEEDTASSERDTIEKLCQLAKRHRNQVLTVFCLPRSCKALKDLFYENLGSMTFVELAEDFATGEKAKSFLKTIAKEQRIRTDKALFAELDPEKGYLATDLRKIFDEWYSRKLKTSVYPQYKNITVIQKTTLKAAPKGSAYDRLEEMVGLTEAKSVIRKALNYYKMQKLFESKGIKPDSPAMHMVFTGNPGTAKTTAARLFAQIMKDNGLLSRGQLVEVGRGDLVGKYVGWTAQTVQDKFKAAKGGVLFIDEAYSLVDNNKGSYGDEAINTIVQEMENHRADVVVIFAGYPQEMEAFLKKNPGLRSRIAFHVPFADYSAEELCQIARLMGKHKGVQFEPAALEKLQAAFEAARQQSDFGNGRYVRNLLEQAKMNQASRLLGYDFDALTDEEIQTLRSEDIVIPEVKTETKRTIGFAC